MAGSIVKEKGRANAEQWRGRIAEQQRSGLSIKQFCEERGLTLWSFYDWRKRLRETGLVRFALVERRSQPEAFSSSNAEVEIVFGTGERLRIRSGVDAATLRTAVAVGTVVEVLKDDSSAGQRARKYVPPCWVLHPYPEERFFASRTF